MVWILYKQWFYCNAYQIICLVQRQFSYNYFDLRLAVSADVESGDGRANCVSFFPSLLLSLSSPPHSLSGDTVLCRSPGFPWILYITNDNLDTSKTQALDIYHHAWFYVGLGTEPRASGILGKTKWVIASALNHSTYNRSKSQSLGLKLVCNIFYTLKGDCILYLL